MLPDNFQMAALKQGENGVPVGLRAGLTHWGAGARVGARRLLRGLGWFCLGSVHSRTAQASAKGGLIGKRGVTFKRFPACCCFAWRDKGTDGNAVCRY